METNDFVKKLENILSFYQLSASAFADKIGFQRSSMSHLLSGRNNPSLDFVMKISSTFKEIDINWFLFDQGTFPKSENQTNQLNDANLVKLNEDLKLQNKKMQQDYEQIILKYDELSKQTNLFTERDSKLKTENKQLNDQVLFLNDEIKRLENLNIQSKSDDDSSLTIKKLEDEVSLLNLDKDQLLLNNKLLQQEKTDLSLKLDKYTRLDNQQNELLAINNKLQAQIEELKLEHQDSLQRIEDLPLLNMQLTKKDEQIENLKNEIKQHQAANESLNEQINASINTIDEQHNTIQTLNNQLNEQLTLTEKNKSSEPMALPLSDVEQVMVLYKNGVFKAYKGQ